MRFLKDNDNNPIGNVLNSGKNNNFMVVLRLRNLCIEIFKSLTKISPTYMNKIFIPESRTRPVRKQHINNLKTVNVKTSTFGTNSIRSLGPKVWNKLPSHMKCNESLSDFKIKIKQWDGITCLCNECNK